MEEKKEELGGRGKRNYEENTSKEARRRQQCQEAEVFGSQLPSSSQEVPSKKLKDTKSELEKVIKPDDKQWIQKLSPDEADKILEQLKREDESLEKISYNSESLTDAQVILSASCRYVLRALRSTDNGWLRSESNLIKLLDESSLKIQSPSIAEETLQEEFSNQEKRDSLLDKLIAKSLSTASQINCPNYLKPVAIAPSFQYGKMEENRTNKEEHETVQYLSRCSILRLPIAAFQLQPEHFQLSDEAIPHLQDIEDQVRLTGAAKSKIGRFIDRFGSHVNYGIFHLGGFYITEAVFQSHKSEKLDHVQSMVSSVLSSSLRIGIGDFFSVGLDGEKLSSLCTVDGKFAQNQLSQVKIQSAKIGGPKEIRSEHKWRAGIARSNREWAVIDCGKELFPIWELIRNCSTLKSADLLANSFQNFLTAGQMNKILDEKKEEEYYRACRDLEIFLSEFSLQMKQSEPSADLWKSGFTHLIEKVHSTLENVSEERKSQMWDPFISAFQELFETLSHQSFILQSNHHEIRKIYLNQLLHFLRECDILHRAVEKLLLVESIQMEDFVFSFRDTLELRTFKLIESEYGKVKYELQCNGLRWVQDEAMVKIRRCDNEGQLTTELRTVKSEMDTFFDKLEDDAVNKLQTFFDQHEKKEVAVRWRAEKINELRQEVKQIKFEYYDKIRNESEEMRVQLKEGENNDKVLREVMARARELAENMTKSDAKSKSLTDDDLKVEFERLWEQLRSEILKRTTQEWNGMDYVETALRDSFVTQKHILNQEMICAMGRDDKREHLFAVTASDIKNSFFTSQIRIKITNKPRDFLLDGNYKSNVLVFANEILSKVQNYVNEIKNKMNEKSPVIDSSVFTGIIRLVDDEIKAYNSERKTGKLKPEFYAFLSVRSCKDAEKELKAIQDEFEKRHGVKAHFASMRQLAFFEFVNGFKCESDEAMAASLVACRIMDIIRERAEKSVAAYATEELLKKYAMNRIDLRERIMSSLVEERVFPDFINFIHGEQSFESMWLLRRTDEMFFLQSSNSHKYFALMKTDIQKRLSEISKVVQSASQSIAEAIKNQSLSENLLPTWINIFCSLETKLGLRKKDFVIYYSVRNIPNFKNILLSKLEDIKNDLLTEFSKVKREEVNWHGDPPWVSIPFQRKHFQRIPEIFPAKLASKTLLEGKHYNKSYKSCPFCGNFVYSIAGGSHLVSQHRPPGIRGIVDPTTNQLLLGTCGSLVRSDATFNCASTNYSCHKKGALKSAEEEIHLFKDYKRYFPWLSFQWDTGYPSDYWKWFMCTFKDSLIVYYEAKMPDLPESWYEITAHDAIESLNPFS